MNRRCYGSPLKYKSITTVGQQGKQNLLATAVMLVTWLLPAVEQKPLFDGCHWAEIVLNIPVLMYRNILAYVMVYTRLSFLM